MKNFLFVFCMLFAITSIAQVPSDSTNVSAEQIMERNNLMCGLRFTDAGLVSKQDPSKGYMVYEVPGLSASELKASTLNTISSLYSSPKDVVTNLSDNMIQLEGYVTRVYYSKAGDSLYPVDFSFNITIQFKDGKIRFNIPTIKQIYMTGVPLLGVAKLDMSKPITVLVDDSTHRSMIAFKLNDLIEAIGKNAKSANDW